MKKMLTFVIAVISLCGLFTILKSDNAYAATTDCWRRTRYTIMIGWRWH